MKHTVSMASSGMYLWILDISVSDKEPLFPKLVLLMRLPTSGWLAHVCCMTVQDTRGQITKVAKQPLDSVLQPNEDVLS